MGLDAGSEIAIGLKDINKHVDICRHEAHIFGEAGRTQIGETQKASTVKIVRVGDNFVGGIIAILITLRGNTIWPWDINLCVPGRAWPKWPKLGKNPPTPN